MMKYFLSIFLMLFISLHSKEKLDNFIGNWWTADKGVVYIYKKDNMYFGKTLKASPDNTTPEKVLGVDVVKHFKLDSKDQNTLIDGILLDPVKDKTYKGKIMFDSKSGNLKVRGYVGFFYATRTWIKMTEKLD